MWGFHKKGRKKEQPQFAPPALYTGEQQFEEEVLQQQHVQVCLLLLEVVPWLPMTDVSRVPTQYQTLEKSFALVQKPWPTVIRAGSSSPEPTDVEHWKKRYCASCCSVSCARH